MSDESVCVIEGCLKPPRTYGLCAKHYEESLRAKMGSCSVEGCDTQARSKGLCNVHYRRRILESKPLCRVENCGRHTVSGDLCDTHRLRFQHHGHLGFTRPEDWGARSSHPLYETWKWVRRRAVIGQEWGDFWRFVADVGARPSPQHKIQRLDPSKPYCPGNWCWREVEIASEDKKARQKEWRQRNPRRSKHYDLTKSYGVSIEWYEATLAAQSGVCAICRQPEKAVAKETQLPRQLAVDHNHTTGAVRGLLCTRCNSLLGHALDSIDILLAAGEYLERYSSAGRTAGVLQER